MKGRRQKEECGTRAALSLRQRGLLHRRAAVVIEMIGQIEDTLKCFNADWFARVSPEDQRAAIVDLRRADDASFALEANLRLSPMLGGVR